MYPIPPSEHLVENRVCKKCNGEFPITNKDMEFYSKVSPSFGGKKYSIPPPTLCPDCREQRREAWQNERKVYKSKCRKTGVDTFSMYRPDTLYTIVSPEYWWSDKWDARDFGKIYRDNISFFTQMSSLMREVPHPSNYLVLSENCDYCDTLRASKDCYYSFNGGAGPSYFERGYYCVATGAGSRDVVDCFWTVRSEQSYECIHVDNVSRSSHCLHSENLDDCHYLRYSSGCSSCTLSEGITNKKYYFMNMEYSPKEYEEKKETFMALPRMEREKRAEAFFFSFPKKATKNVMTENVYGDYISGAKDSHYTFFGGDVHDLRYCFTVFGAEDSMDCTNYGVNCRHCYETYNVWHAYNVNLSISCTENPLIKIYQ